MIAVPVEFFDWAEWREFVRTRDQTWRDEYPPKRGTQRMNRMRVVPGMAAEQISEVMVRNLEAPYIWARDVLELTGCL